MSEAPRVVVLAGPNGAGKSTASQGILRDELGIQDFVNADTLARGLSADVSIQRVSERVAHGGHDIPVETIRRRYAAGLSNFLISICLLLTNGVCTIIRCVFSLN